MTVYFLNNQLKKLTKWIKSYRFIKKREVTLKCNKKKGAISAYEKSYSETCSISHLRFRHPVTSDKHKCMVPKYLFNTLCQNKKPSCIPKHVTSDIRYCFHVLVLLIILN